MRTEYSIKNSITSFISNIVTFVLLFVSQTIFIKVFGVEYNGLSGLFSNILTLLNLFELGISSSITYNLYKYTKEKDIETIKSIMRFYKKAYNYVSVIITIVGLLFIPFLKHIVNDMTADINIYFVYLFFLINTVSTYLISYKRNLLNAYQRSYIINIIHIICTFLVNLLQILVIYITKNYYLYLMVKILCIILENLIISYKVNRDYPYMLDKNIKHLETKTKKNISDRIKALFVHRMSFVITNGTDNIIISTFIGIKVLGIYTNYFYIIKMVKTLLVNTITSITASVGNLLLENDYEKNYSTFRKTNFLFLWLAIFTSTCLLLLINPFITIWLGKEFLLDRFVLIILVINYFQTVIRYSYSIFKDGAGIWIEDKYVAIIQAILNVFFSILLVKIIGLAGVFMGTIISSLVLWLYTYPKFVYKRLFNKNLAAYLNHILIDLLLFVIINLISYGVNIYSTNIFISFIICLIVPNIILYIIFNNTDEFIYYKKLLIKMIRKKI